MFSSMKSRLERAARTAIPIAVCAMCATPAFCGPFFFGTGNPDGQMATASRPDSPGKFEIESADDFVLTQTTSITSATFTGLLTGGATVGDIGLVRVEIYRVFPKDSDTTRTPNVPTRTNSPSDVESADRDTVTGNMSFSTTDLGSFAAANSVLPGGIHPKPGQATGGNGPVTGEEIEFSVDFTTPFDLPPDHYFFVPQVEMTDAADNFLWLSAPRPIVPPGTALPPGFTDLQSWTRDAQLAPDWLRVGTDIVGPGTTGTAPTFNAAFSLSGQVIPEPATLLLIALGLGILWWGLKRKP